jgi:predicted RNA binding protein YcfA (HicA-like mRNA interferase family)
MKYSELERLLRRNGCYYVGGSLFGHPKWYSPITKDYFAMSHHHSEEVPNGTLKKILKASGLELNY